MNLPNVLKKLVIGFLLIPGAAASGAAAPFQPHIYNPATDNPLCQKERSESIREISGDLDKLDAVVPQIPPDEKSYLAKESADAMKVEDEARYNSVASRPYFEAWETHKQIDAARASLNAILAIPGSASPKQHIQSAARAVADLSNVATEWEEFGHTALAVRSKADANYYYYARHMPVAIGEYLWCWADMMP